MTDAWPGSEAKVELLIHRYATGQSLWHEDDPTFADSPEGWFPRVDYPTVLNAQGRQYTRRKLTLKEWTVWVLWQAAWVTECVMYKTGITHCRVNQIWVKMKKDD